MDTYTVHYQQSFIIIVLVMNDCFNALTYYINLLRHKMKIPNSISVVC